MKHKVTAIVVTHFLSHEKYRALCFQSLYNNKQDPKIDLEIVVVSSTEEPINPPDYIDKCFHRPHTTKAPEDYNYGAQQMRQDSDWIFMMNDDTILTPNCLSELIESTEGQKMILNPWCNTDKGWLYDEKLYLGDFQVPRFMHVETVEGMEEKLIQYDTSTRQRILLKTPFNCFHGTLIPAKLWHFLGGLDENYDSGPDDLDFCIRARKLGVETFLNLKPVMWHFGGTSVAKKPQHDEKRIRNAEYFKSKHGYYPQ